MDRVIEANAKKGTAVTLGADFVCGFKALYIGVTGNVKVDMPGGGTGILFVAVPVGFFPVSVTKVYSTANGTTAASILGLEW